MQLPDAAHAIVDDAKVRDYLLSSEHPVGRFKARVFAAAGYRRESWRVLRDDLLLLARGLEVELRASDEHGHRYVGAGVFPGRSGPPLPITTVWLISSEGEPPRLITAYPVRES
jgi:hypothetical protein